MALLILAFLGGILTIFSPCILPVLPFALSKADQPFRKAGLPLLAGMALTFAAIAALATVGGGWIVRANQYGRLVALVVLAIFGLTLLSEALANWIVRPLVRLGGHIASSDSGGESGVSRSLLLGGATGLLWAPCAGPILGLILTGAAIGGANLQTAFLLLAFSAGAAFSLAIVLLAGQRIEPRLQILCLV
jgi:cytochrome c biogenesis protein CcdA